MTFKASCNLVPTLLASSPTKFGQFCHLQPLLSNMHTHNSTPVLTVFLKCPGANATALWSLWLPWSWSVPPYSASTVRCVVSCEPDFILTSVLVIDLWFPRGKVNSLRKLRFFFSFVFFPDLSQCHPGSGSSTHVRMVIQKSDSLCNRRSYAIEIILEMIFFFWWWDLAGVPPLHRISQFRISGYCLQSPPCYWCSGIVIYPQDNELLYC